MSTDGTDRPGETGWYEIRLEGHLDQRWSAWFGGMEIRTAPDGTTALNGSVVDQAALHGLLSKLRDLGVPIISLERREPGGAQEPTHPDTSTGD